MTASPVSIEQARLAHKLGIKLRKSDAKYGFKLPCPVCGKPVEDSCFCAKTIELAIKAVQNRKAPWGCSRKCALMMDDRWDDDIAAIEDFYSSPDETSGTFVDLQAFLKEFVPLAYDPKLEIYVGWSRRRRWMQQLRVKNRPKYEEIISFFAEEVEPEGEPWEDDEGEIDHCSCEI